MIDFIRLRWLMALYSFTILALFSGVYVYKWYTRGYTFSYSIDFTGGTQVLFKFDKPVSALELKSILGRKGLDVVVREFSPQEVLIRVKEFEGNVVGLAERIRQMIKEEMPHIEVTILQSESVGPGIGKSLRTDAVYALALGLIAMLFYIAIRFWSLGFALGAVVALIHDALIMLAVFLFFDREISVNVIGAILAVLGYSINDTIVIFSQIRDNLHKLAGAHSLKDIVNISINQTLRRTILTSISTALVVLSLLIFGGEVLRDFSIALLVGIIFGTYSSIYIASPIMMLLHKK